MLSASYVCINARVYVRICVCLCVCVLVHVRICVCVYLFMYVYVYVCECTCLWLCSEGLDIDEVDLIVMFDPVKSPVRLTQRMGRTGRKRPGKVVALVSGRGDRSDKRGGQG